MNPTLTIVTICYNDLAGLRKTIASLSSQTCVEFSQRIVDGGSNDGTVDFLEQLTTPWQMQWSSQKDRGIYDAMNKGAHAAPGEYVWFLNSGDYLADPSVVADVLKVLSMEGSGRMDLLYGNIFFESPDGRRKIGREVRADQFMGDMLLSTPASIFRKELILATPYRTDFKIISDWILIRGLFESGAKTVYFDRTLAVFNTDGISSKNRWKLLSEKLTYERSLFARLEILARSGGKYLVLSILGKIGLLGVLRKRQYRRGQ